ncbi:hypothetical protein Zmor_021215 [Zophobas morio]|uniref:Uncharacterized protein n=1 Tax=Zophobas morio TaxID=2755281 RepID=A0AA38MAC0_9CUCU|nr:hypothetical protein Zmor_021215 [Zophobas morio]
MRARQGEPERMIHAVANAFTRSCDRGIDPNKYVRSASWLQCLVPLPCLCPWSMVHVPCRTEFSLMYRYQSDSVRSASARSWNGSRQCETLQLTYTLERLSCLALPRSRSASYLYPP